VAFQRRRSRSRYLWIFIALVVLTYALGGPIRTYGRLAVQLATLGGVALGDTRGEVRYKRGDPPFVYGAVNPGETVVHVYYTDRQKDPDNAMPEGTEIDAYQTWSYATNPSLNVRLDVSFDAKSGRASRIDCVDKSDPPTFYCGNVAEIGIWDPESRVTILLGTPTQQSIDQKSGVKTMEYRDIGVIFQLRQQRVYGISVVGTGPSKPMPLNRFLSWMIGSAWLWTQ
jgi:hypothetical protein